jgi:hypothetical protein|tara:strand:+ start:735 stop:947 length:213 start_codon:yes stop_codon:yes gene_type:complete
MAVCLTSHPGVTIWVANSPQIKKTATGDSQVAFSLLLRKRGGLDVFGHFRPPGHSGQLRRTASLVVTAPD